MVDDTGLELAGAGRCASGVRGRSARASAGSTCLRHGSQVRGPTFQQKQNGHPFRDDRLFLVDDTRLEVRGASAETAKSVPICSVS